MDRLTYDLRDGVARITLDDGRLNVMSLDMLEAISRALDQAARDAAVVRLESGRPGVFSAGFDLKVFSSGDPAASLAMVRAGAELALKLLTHPDPVLAICAGHAFPMGAFLILASDLRIGAVGDWRIGLNEVAIGIAPPGFALEVARQRLTPAWLNRTALTGEMCPATEAAAAGFLDRLVAPADLEAAAHAAQETLKGIDRPSHRTAKARLRAGPAAAMRAAIDRELTLEAYAGRPPSAVRLPKAG